MCIYYIDAFVCVTTTEDEVKEERRNTGQRTCTDPPGQ